MSETTVMPTTEPTPAQKFSAEVFGTFCLVFFGVGTALSTGGEILTIGLAFGLIVMVMAYSVGRISGGHFNPAVTVGAATGGRLAWSQVPAYIGAQLAGAIGAALLLWILWQGVPGFSSDGSFGQNAFGGQTSLGLAWWAAFLLELVATMVFLLVILSVTDERNQHPAMAPLAIGLTLSMIHFALIPLTGSSLNPARSIGPALFAGGDAIVQLWLYILAPLAGGVLAGLLYPMLFGLHGEPVAGSGLRFGRRQVAGVPGYGAPDAYQQQWNQEYPQGQQQGQATGQPQAQAPWPQQPQEQWQPQQPEQPQYPAQPEYPAQPPQQAWPQQPAQPAQPPQPVQPAQPSPPAEPPAQQPWPDSDDDQMGNRPPG